MARNLSFDDAGYLIVDQDLSNSRGPFPSKRRRLDVPRLASEPQYVCDGSESLWQVAARPEVYGNQRYWWILADVNNISGIFAAMFSKLERGTELRVPDLDLVNKVIANGGR